MPVQSNQYEKFLKGNIIDKTSKPKQTVNDIQMHIPEDRLYFVIIIPIGSVYNISELVAAMDWLDWCQTDD